MNKTLRIVAISDTHNQHERLDIPEGDILIHAGDMSVKGSLEELAAFDAFAATLPHPVKIVIAGNHDTCLERNPEEARAQLEHVVYLQDESYFVEGLHLYGTPWQPCYNDWAFNLPRGAALREKWELIPEGVDILITHGPPYGIRDTSTKSEKLGCRELLEVVKLRKPSFHIFGHVHEGAGEERRKHTHFINASSLTRRRKSTYPPIVFDIQV